MWFKSKIEHPDPAIRREHVEGLEPGDPVLQQVARTDPHPDVRSAALSRILDIESLRELGRSDADDRVRGLAMARLQSLLSGHADGAPELDRRMAFMAESDDHRLTRYLARNAREPELRRQSVDRLLEQTAEGEVLDLLCDIAASDPVSEIRSAAADPIGDPQRLQRMADLSRDRDKSIHRLARERLEAIAAQEEAREGLDRVVTDIEELAGSEPGSDGAVERGRLATLTAEWEKHSAVETPAEAARARFLKAKEKIEGRLESLRELQQQRDAVMNALRSHLEDEPGETVSELIRRWHELGDPEPSAERAFEKLLHEVAEHNSRRERDVQRRTAKERILEKMEKKLAETPLRAGELKNFEDAWDAARDPGDGEALRDRFLALREKFRARLVEQTRNREEELAKLTALLDDYEENLKAGKLREAGSAHDKTVSALARLELPEADRTKLEKRLRAGEPRMAELKRWRHWGTNRKREELCEQAEALPESGKKIPEVARAVREYRNEWKMLDRSDGPAGKKLWERFDTACEKAYAPCQAYFDEQKTQRDANLAQRVAICEKLETLATETDWESPPWRDLADALRQAQQAWHKAGSVDRREQSRIQKRFDKARAAIDEHLGVKRKTEIERRERLIAEVEAAAEGGESREAANAARAAQKQWKPLVQASRRKEQQLWKRFRAACDAVFERRKEQFAAADKERAQNLAEKLAVQGQVEEMTKTLQDVLESESADADQVRETRKRIRQLGNGWRRIGPVPREKSQEVDKRFRQASKDLETLCARIERRLEQAALDRLRSAAADCVELERRAAAGDELDVESIDALGTALGAAGQDESFEARLEILRAAAGGSAEAVETIRGAMRDNLEMRRRLCLELEIAAGVESPEDVREERMQFRVAQLSASMTGAGQTRTPAELERRWYATGAVPETDGEELEHRFRRAMEAIRTA